MISLDIFGDPVPKKRARTFNNRGKIVTWDSQDKIKEGYKWQIRSQYREEPLGCPVVLDVIFHMPIPKSTSKVKQRAMLNGTYHHMVKPDIDNLEKFLYDVLNEVVIKNDSQIVEVHAKKVYSSKPGTYVRIFPVEQVCQQPDENAHDLRNHR